MAQALKDFGVKDVLIVESTYGTQVHPPAREREARLTKAVTDIVSRGGRCLVRWRYLGLRLLRERSLVRRFGGGLGSRIVKAKAQHRLRHVAAVLCHD